MSYFDYGHVQANSIEDALDSMNKFGEQGYRLLPETWERHKEERATGTIVWYEFLLEFKGPEE